MPSNRALATLAALCLAVTTVAAGNAELQAAIAAKEAAVARAIFGADELIDSPDASAGASAGYEDTVGTTDVAQIFNAPGSNVMTITEEFGTVPGILVVRSLVLENAAYWHGRGLDRQLAAGRNLRDVFYVPTTAWKANTLRKGQLAIGRALVHLAKRGE